MGYTFTRQECIRALLRIGFIDKSKRKAKHDKYKPPYVLETIPKNIKPFIMVPRHDFYCQDAIVAEIKKLCGQAMVDKFLDNLK